MIYPLSPEILKSREETNQKALAAEDTLTRLLREKGSGEEVERARHEASKAWDEWYKFYRSQIWIHDPQSSCYKGRRTEDGGGGGKKSG